jgi:hypothetical protein
MKNSTKMIKGILNFRGMIMDQKNMLGIFTVIVMGVMAFGFLSEPLWAQTRPALVKDVENPAQTPFWGYDAGTIPVDWANTMLVVGTIPAGKRLVIEHVAVSCTMDSDDGISRVEIHINKKNETGYNSYKVPLSAQRQGNTYNGKSSWTVSQPVRLYSDGGTTSTSVEVNRSKTTATASCYAIVSGYTVDTP